MSPRFMLMIGLLVACRVACAAGFEALSVPLPGGRHATGGVWYPSAARGTATRLDLYTVPVVVNGPVRGADLPLVILSHGSGGSHLGHVDTAIALADAGFVVAAINHPADNVFDSSGLGTPRQLVDRVTDLSALVDFMLDGWRHRSVIDSSSVGAFGFSAGGYAVLVAIGGRPLYERLPAHCADLASDPICRAYAPRWHSMQAAKVPPPEPRLKAAVLAAPGLGFVFDEASLNQVRTPVQLWRAKEDEVLRSPHHVEPVARALGGKVEYHEVEGAGHFAFLAPCPPDLAAIASDVCTDRGNFSRAAFHRQMNAAVARFFRSILTR